MSWDKPVRPEDVKLVPGRMEVERYIYTPGVHGVELAKALVDGKILGMKCGDSIYFPPLTICPDHSRGELVELGDTVWVVEAYTIVRKDLYGRELDKPRVVAFIKPKGALGGVIHYLNVDPGDARVGMEVEPVFRRERRGLITDIEYFKPSGKQSPD